MNWHWQDALTVAEIRWIDDHDFEPDNCSCDASADCVDEDQLSGFIRVA